MQSDIQSQMSQSQMSQSQMSQSQMSQFQVPHTRNPKPGIMKAAVYKENGIITLEHRPVPALADPQDAIIRVTLTTICSSDIHIKHGAVPRAVPGTILFADAAVVFLIVVNRLNWQSYFMYQIAITVFSFIPLILWAAGLVTHPAMAIITVILTVGILALTIFLGDRRFKNELIRRFHL